AALPKLEVIAVFGVGTDGIDLAAARERNIPVTNTPGVLTDEVADLAIGLMLASARQILFADRYVRDGSWARKGRIPLGRTARGLDCRGRRPGHRPDARFCAANPVRRSLRARRQLGEQRSDPPRAQRRRQDHGGAPAR